MRRFGFLLLATALAVAVLPGGLAHADSPLRASTTHTLDGYTPGEGDPYFGYMRGWVGEIDFDFDGDVDGNIVWWIELATWDVGETSSSYAFRTEIWDSYPDGNLLLATAEHGRTSLTKSNWHGGGVIVEVAPDWEYAHLLGHGVTQRGTFTTAVFPWEGTSIFIAK
jgi:hypothetical protein